MTIKEFDTVNDNYEFEFHFSKELLPDTNQPAFNDLVKAPDLLSWGMWKSTGFNALYPYMTEFIARAKTSYPFNVPLPLYN